MKRCMKVLKLIYEIFERAERNESEKKNKKIWEPTENRWKTKNDKRS